MARVEEILAKLESFDRDATPGPWYLRQMDDEMRMGALAVCTTPPTSMNENMRDGTWPGEEVVAVCSLQYPPYAVIKDDRDEKNALLIAEIRNLLPEIIGIVRKFAELK